MKTTVVNIRREKCDVYIGRRTKTPYCHYGNPFIIGRDGTRADVIQKFREWITGADHPTIEPTRRQWILNNLQFLQGKKLGCFCKPEACHGDVYIEILYN